MSSEFNSNDKIFEKIKKIVVDVTLTSENELTRDTRICDDLGLAGIDVEDIIVPFFKKFKIQEGDFDFLRYFDPETVDILGIEYIRCKFKKVKYPPKEKIVTLGDLEKIAMTKVWQDSLIPYREPYPLSFIEKLFIFIFGYIFTILLWIAIILVLLAFLFWIYYDIF